MKKVILLGILIAATLSGCKSTPYKVNLAKEKLTTNRISEIDSVIKQDEIEVKVPVSDSSAAGAQFGLIGAIITSSIDSSVNQSNAELYDQVINPVKDSLVNYNFNKHFNQKLSHNLSSEPIFNQSKIHDMKSEDNHELLEKQVLKLNTRYTYSSDFRTLIVSTSAIIEDTSTVETSVLYQNTFTYNSKRLLESVLYESKGEKLIAERKAKYFQLTKKQRKSSTEVNKLNKDLKKIRRQYSEADKLNKYAVQWSNNNGELTKNELIKATDAIHNMLIIDINKENRPEEYETADKFTYNGKKYAVTLLKESENKSRAILQKTVGYSAGQLCSIPLENLDEFNIASCVN